MSFYTIKRMIVVMAIGALVFALAKPFILRFMSKDDFARRRMVWLILTATCFLCLSFWLYVVVAAPVFIWAYKKDSNPLALYLMMLHVVPPVGFAIPFLGNNGLFDLDNYRLLSFCVLLPAVMRYRKERKERRMPAEFSAMDVLLLAFGALTILLYTPPDLPTAIPDSPTNLIRRGVLFFLDTYLVYYMVSRTVRTRSQLVDVAAAYVLSCAVLAGIGIFENLRHWLLYVETLADWGVFLSATTWLMRGDELRAMASTGHSLSLGYMLAVSFGFWLYLKSHVDNAITRNAVTLLIWGGLLAAYSRGAWLGAVVIYFAFFAAGPRAVSRTTKSATAAGAFLTLILLSPLGDRIMDVLPFFGHSKDFNIIYREHLAERGWDIVFAHPLFGDQYPWPKLEDLRQGEGIIDIVNTYLGVALNYGFVGLFCFVGFILLVTVTIFVRSRSFIQSDPDLALFGASLIACIIGTCIMIDSMSFNLACSKMFLILAGLGTAYARLTSTPQVQPVVLSARNAR